MQVNKGKLYTDKQYIELLKEEIKRLNKIINEMEKFLEEHEATYTLKEFRKIKDENNE